MTQGSSVLRHVLGHLAGLVAFALVSGAGALIYVWTMADTFGRDSGMAGAVLIVFVPLAVCTIGLFLWLPLWFGVWAFRGFQTWMFIAGVALVVSLAASFIYCGGFERCFLPGGHERMLGTFFTATFIACALAHNAVVKWIAERG